VELQVGAANVPLGTKERPLTNFLNKLLKEEDGATAIEYGLIAALIAVAAISAMSGLGKQLGATFNNVSTELKKGATS
jgi:pilus assembly protein Flp/PilA